MVLWSQESSASPGSQYAILSNTPLPKGSICIIFPWHDLSIFQDSNADAKGSPVKSKILTSSFNNQSLMLGVWLSFSWYLEQLKGESYTTLEPKASSWTIVYENYYQGRYQLFPSYLLKCEHKKAR